MGALPANGSQAPDFNLTKSDLSSASLADYAGKKVVLNIFPSVDTGTCAQSVRQFNQEAAELENTAILCISKDLPFAQAGFAGPRASTRSKCYPILGTEASGKPTN